MIVIDVSAELEKLEQAEKNPPKPEVTDIDVILVEIPENDDPEIAEKYEIEEETVDYRGKAEIIAELTHEMRELRIARARLSNKIAPMVRSGATQEALAALASDIQSYTDRMKVVYDKMQHVERYGMLPKPKEPDKSPLESADLMELRKYARRLVDKRCKLQAKLKPNGKVPVNDARIALWQMELEKSDAEYRAVKEKIRKLKHEHRNRKKEEVQEG